MRFHFLNSCDTHTLVWVSFCMQAFSSAVKLFLSNVKSLNNRRFLLFYRYLRQLNFHTGEHLLLHQRTENWEFHGVVESFLISFVGSFFLLLYFFVHINTLWSKRFLYDLGLDEQCCTHLTIASPASLRYIWIAQHVDNRLPWSIDPQLLQGRGCLLLLGRTKELLDFHCHLN